MVNTASILNTVNMLNTASAEQEQYEEANSRIFQLTQRPTNRVDEWSLALDQSASKRIHNSLGDPVSCHGMEHLLRLFR